MHKIQKLSSSAFLSKYNLYLLAAVLFMASLVVPFFSGVQKAHAAGLVSSRSIKMSSSAVSATGVSYTVSFTAATTATISEIVVDFCDGTSSPIVGEACSTTGDPSLGATPSVTCTSNCPTSPTYTTESASPYTTLCITGTGVAYTGGSTTVSFTINSVTNPTPNGSFYARITDYTSANEPLSGSCASWSSTSPGTFTDYGGVALSTANQLTITAKVQEQLTFCVDANTTALTSCGSASGTTINLGDTKGVLYTTGPFVDKTGQYLVQTNAVHDAVVNMQGGLLASGSNTFPNLASPTLSAAGTSQFGLCSYPSGGTTANMTITQNYNGANSATPGTLCSGTTQTSGTGATGGNDNAYYYYPAAVQGTYGDTIATQVPGSFATGTLVFLGNVSATQPAGIYTTTLTFVATGTY